MPLADQIPRGDDDVVRRLGLLEAAYQQVIALAGSAKAIAQAIQTGLGTLASSGTTWAGPLAAPSDISVGGNINAGGTLISPYARAHSVVTGYVAAYLDSSGVLLSTPSSLRMKRDIVDAHWTPEQWRGIRTVFYRLRAAYILADMEGKDPSQVERLAGVIGEELLALGLDEFVVLDDRGRVFTVRYELLGLIAVDAAQQLASQIDDLRGEFEALRNELRG